MSNDIKIISFNKNNDDRKTPEKWFERLFGFEEIDTKKTIQLYHQIKDNENIVGNFTTPSVYELRNTYFQMLKNISRKNIINKIKEPTIEHIVVNDILSIHSQYPNAVFQVASQLNCLEFCNSNITPSNGITEYIYDYTQGPACSLACAIGTFYRNYSQIDNQINNLCELEKHLPGLWNVHNGYIFSDTKRIKELNFILSKINSYDAFIDSIRIGLHKNNLVTFKDRDFIPIIKDNIKVTQCFCAAINCGYSRLSADLWEKLAQIVLDANYEATIWASAINTIHNNSNHLFLTFLGGGVFGNKREWIAKSIKRAIRVAKENNLDINIKICHLREINEDIVNMLV